MRFETGTCLGPYEILAPLGAGGMGEVYRARDTRLERDVAIKVLPEQFASDPTALARFEREAKAIAALSHPNILAIHDVGTEQNTSFVVTELLEGETLRERLQQGALPWRKAVEIGAAIADGLAAAHAKGIVHRDLKPENIFLTSDGVVKILDFGLARSMGPVSPEDQADAPTLTLETKPGTVMGTPAYMSPEQVRGKRVDVRSDIFSFGCVFYEMVTGDRAFARKTPIEMAAAILKEEPPDLSDMGVSVPPELQRDMRHCLEKRADDRFQSARDLGFALRAVLTDSERAQTVAATPELRSRISAWIVPSIVTVVALVALFAALNPGNWRERLFGRSMPTPSEGMARPAITSLVVLPLENLSGDPEQEYFVDGMTDALIANLGQVSALRVISRTSAMHFKGTDKSIPEIARQLGVDAAVEGSVVRAGDRVRITAQLIHGPTDSHLWANSYERELRNVLALQSEVAQAIAREIRVKLTPQEQSHLAGTRQVDPEAYQLYLKGRYFWNKRTEQGLNQAVDYFRRAIEIDPTYALAYAALADCYVLMPEYGSLPSTEALPKAKAAALKALEIDDTLAEAHASLGMFREQYDWDWSGAEESFKRAIELKPTYATAHHWYAIFLMDSARQDESLAQIKQAQQLDPLSVAISGCAGYMFYHARQYDRAIEEFRKALELDPDSASAHSGLAEVYVQKGMYELAVAEAQRAAELSRGRPADLGMLGVAYARAGQGAEARRLLSDLEGAPEEQPLQAWSIGVICAALGDHDQAFEWLNRSCDRRDVYVLALKACPLFDPLRGDPRFDDLLRRIGLEPDTEHPPSTQPTESSDAAPSHRIMLAVLPFEDMSPEPAEWFSDGMTEEMIAQLGRLQPQKLGVIARTSAMRFKGTDKGIDQIGRELGVDYILEGSVRRAGERVRVTASLVNVSDETTRWAHEYDDRSVADVFDVQADVAKRIASALALELLPGERARLASPRRVDPEAHEAYLKGRYYWNKRTEEGLQKSLEYFRQAIDLEPTYPLAYVGLADAYALHPEYGSLSPEKAYPLARAAAEKALELDDRLGEAYAILGSVKCGYDWDWSGAEEDYQRAIELNPGYATARHWHALSLAYRGRSEKAIAEIKRAQELDPLSLIMNVAAGWILYSSREYDQAVEELRKTLEMSPSFAPAHLRLAMVYMHKRMYDQAIAESQHAIRLSGGHPGNVAVLGMAYALAGMPDEARARLDELEALAQQRYVSPMAFAYIYVGLGDHDRAFEWLEKAREDRSYDLLDIKVDPLYDSLRDDPRFDDLLRRIGLEP